ncbi:phosducin-like protein [Leptinotarsa decemlineata]|uniref:phosducin-like protein n=1 Tax=Leptinotarsa decemlineata TaxID=7539 RepID=UPI000C25252B|nr:phosducin-like protein [Leptinotarsa decemlineata]
MSTLEDKILGEKNHNYCSSSEESDCEDNSDPEEPIKKQNENQESVQSTEINKWEGTSTNTGPKGVIKDWQRYKQLENERRQEDEREKIELMKKLTLTVQSALDEEREKATLEDPDLAELLNDEFLINYQKQRMKEMILQTNHNVKFGNLILLKSGQEFLDAIDKEHKSVTIIVHIYEENVDACRAMNMCLKELSKHYLNVKFCSIIGSCAGISQQFKADGVPALLVYKSGNLVGNFIRISDDLGNDFLPEDVQAYLVEHGLLEDKSCTPALIKSVVEDSESD